MALLNHSMKTQNIAHKFHCLYCLYSNIQTTGNKFQLLLQDSKDYLMDIMATNWDDSYG